MTIPGLEQAEVPPLGELGMAGFLPDGLKIRKKFLMTSHTVPNNFVFPNFAL